MMKTDKNRRRPTCSRCRFHGKKDVRVLQHACPFRNCTCSSCFLIKRRSIIYRAQKNLDKTEENSNDAESSGGSGDGSALSSSNYNDLNGKSIANCSISRSSDSSSDATNFGTPSGVSDGTAISSTAQPWAPVDHVPQHSGIASTSTSSVKSADHYRISDFQSLCLTFPELTPSQLQSVFEQCDADSRPSVQFQNNNDWSSTTNPISGDYASNGPSFGRSALTAGPAMMGTDASAPTFYSANANNGDFCYDWRSNSTGLSSDDFSNADYGCDYTSYYDQSLGSCGVISTQGNQLAYSPNWNYEYSGHWYNSQGSGSGGSGSGSTGSSGSYELSDTGWQTGHSGQSLALGHTMHDHNI